MSIQLENIKNMLTGVRPAPNNNFQCNCPCSYHKKENNGKLYIKDGGDMVLIDCKSGCTANEVMAALGLQLKDLYPPRTPEAMNTYREVARLQKIERINEDKAFNLWVELKVITQCLEGRMYGEDEHPERKIDCWDREKQALALLPKLLNDYYK